MASLIKFKTLSDKISPLFRWPAVKSHLFHPFSLACLASVGVHVLILEVLLPNATALNATRSVKQQQVVRLMTLTRAEQSRLPNLSASSLNRSSLSSLLHQPNSSAPITPSHPSSAATAPSTAPRRSLAPRFRRRSSPSWPITLPIPAPPPLSPGLSRPPITSPANRPQPSTTPTSPPPVQQNQPEDNATPTPDSSELATHSSPSQPPESSTPAGTLSTEAQDAPATSNEGANQALIERMIASNDVRLSEELPTLRGTYTPAACRRKLAGVVGFLVKLGPQGQLSSRELIKSSGSPLLDQQATQDLTRQALNNPSGEARPYTVKVNFQYDETQCAGHLPPTADTSDVLGNEPIEPNNQPANESSLPTPTPPLKLPNQDESGTTENVLPPEADVSPEPVTGDRDAPRHDPPTERP